VNKLDLGNGNFIEGCKPDVTDSDQNKITEEAKTRLHCLEVTRRQG
jgi:hypothetical protein